jgi:Fe-S-cluster containining protein
MVSVPWRHVNSWLCNGCGLCCREFEVVLRFDEWLNLIRTYGMSVTKAGLNSFYLGKKSDETCLFLCSLYGRWLCGLQNMKPMACKIWPFKILGHPRYGSAREAIFRYNERDFFVYVDSFCPQISWGQPTPELVRKIIPEFIEIALGTRKKQAYSTSSTMSSLFPPANRDYKLI